jgi:hypothetical protein
MTAVKAGHLRFAEKMVKDLMWEAGHNGFTQEDLSDAVGPSCRTMENYQYGSMPTLAGFMGIYRTVRPERLAEKLAGVCGGFFVRPRVPDRPSAMLTRQTAQIMKETADVLNAVAAALHDDKIDKGERLAILKEVDEAVTELMTLKVYLSEGNRGR